MPVIIGELAAEACKNPLPNRSDNCMLHMQHKVVLPVIMAGWGRWDWSPRPSAWPRVIRGVLSLVLARLPGDWQHRDGVGSLLVER